MGLELICAAMTQIPDFQTFMKDTKWERGMEGDDIHGVIISALSQKYSPVWLNCDGYFLWTNTLPKFMVQDHIHCISLCAGSWSPSYPTPTGALIMIARNYWSAPSMFYHVLPMFTPFGATGIAYRQIRPFWTPKSNFWAFLRPLLTFSGGIKGPNWPPRMWNTMFTHCSTHLGLLGPPMAKYVHFWPKKATFGRFWGPYWYFLGAEKGPNWSPRMWRTMFNHVHPIFNPFGAAEAAYGQI